MSSVKREATGKTRRTRPPGGALPRPGADRLLEGVLALGRDLHLGMDEGELAARFLTTIAELFPGRLVAIRVEPRDGRGDRVLTATPGATFRPGVERGPLALKRSALEKAQLGPEAVAAGRVRLVKSPEPIFEAGEPGFSIPLVSAGELYGALDVAYPKGADLPDEDEPTLIPIANQLSVALRNVRLHAEGELLREYLSKLVDHADALILGVDARWRITVFNRAIARLTGWDAFEMLGTDLRRWLPENERSRLVHLVLEALAGRTAAAVDVELATRSGAHVRTVWNVAAIGAGKRIEAVVAVGQDVTRLKSLERQVIQAEKLATLGQLAAGVVHELNNPLTSVIVYADYLLKKLERADREKNPFEPSDGDKLRRILEGAERILNFSRDLVQYAKPTAEQLDVISFNDVVRQSLSFCEHVFKKADVRLDCALEGELAPMYAVRGQLQQVVINLVTNAVHAQAAGGGRVRVRTFAPDTDHVGLEVADEGVGIKADDLERIFDPFFTTKTDGRGTGLGLSIVRNIVERHRGTISVDSAPGRGATFRLVLPTGHRQPPED